jgi:hypothetical protein
LFAILTIQKFTASFIAEVRDRSQSEAEAEIEKLCVEFEENKEHLVNNWK